MMSEGCSIISKTSINKPTMPNPYLDKRKASGPFLPKWSQVKGRHEVLSNGSIFKPDISQVISRYDQSLKDYDDLIKEEAKLKDIIADLMKQNDASSMQIKSLAEEVAKLTKAAQDSMQKDGEQLRKFAASGGDSAGISETLQDVVSLAEDFVNKRKARWEELDGTSYENLNRFKKVR